MSWIKPPIVCEKRTNGKNFQNILHLFIMLKTTLPSQWHCASVYVIKLQQQCHKSLQSRKTIKIQVASFQNNSQQFSYKNSISTSLPTLLAKTRNSAYELLLLQEKKQLQVFWISPSTTRWLRIHTIHQAFYFIEHLSNK